MACMIYLLDSAAPEPSQGLPNQKRPPFSAAAPAGGEERLRVGEGARKKEEAKLPAPALIGE